MIVDYIEDAIEKHCLSFPVSPFSVRILFGGENKDWNGTPLQDIYNYYYVEQGRSHTMSAKAAAVDVGKMMKKTILESSHIYQYAGKDTGMKYVRKQCE